MISTTSILFKTGAQFHRVLGTKEHETDPTKILTYCKGFTFVVNDIHFCLSLPIASGLLNTITETSTFFHA